MPRRRGHDDKQTEVPSSGTQYEQQVDTRAHSRNRKPTSPRAKQRDSEIAKKTPPGDQATRRKTS
jgi:hypothetical protein